LIVTGEIFDVRNFLLRHPDVFWEIALVSFYSAMGQLFIFLTIAQFGALTNTIVTTMRKFLTIVANTWWYGHSMGALKWAAVGGVAGGVFLERYSDGLEKADKARADRERKEKEKVKAE